MTERDFCDWLRGFFELHEKGVRIDGGMQLTTEQVQMIIEHLKSVFDSKIMQQTTVTFSPTDISNPIISPQQTKFIC